jgi:hypothetical protein
VLHFRIPLSANRGLCLPSVSGVSEVIHLQVTANSHEGTSSATSTTTALLNVNVAPIVVQGVQIHTDDTDRFKIVPILSDPDATLVSLSIGGLPQDVEHSSTNFKLLDSNGNSIPFNNVTFNPGANPDFNDASVSISDPTQIQSAIANGLQLVRIDGNGNPVSIAVRVCGAGNA